MSDESENKETEVKTDTVESADAKTADKPSALEADSASALEAENTASTMPEDEAVDEAADDEPESEDDPAEDAGEPEGEEKSADTESTSPKNETRIGSPAAAKKRAAARRRRQSSQGSPMRNIMLFVVVIVGTATVFGVIGNSSQSSKRSKPKWKIGQTAPISLTVVTPDHRNLQCALKGNIKGLRCLYESENKLHSEVKNKDSRSNEKLLQPYTTTDGGLQIMAAGLWAQPELKAKLAKENPKLPSPRFSVKCSFTVRGLSKQGRVRWKAGGPWYNGHGWYAGEVTKCKIE